MRKLFLLLCGFVFLAVQAQAQKTITGKVTDEKGNPIANVSVMVKGTTTGTATKADGTYSLAVPASARTLVFSYADMTPEEVTIGSQVMINSSLKAEDKSLSEVVVVGYGTQRKKDVTGTVATVKGAAVSNKPIQSFEQALGGRAAGVQITIPNGVLNNPPVIRIRGTNSLSLSSYPLIVVDGVPTFTGDASGSNAAGNALASINPNDIESIDIAKDAASSAIYGSRAANGVLFITTKKGKLGKARVTYDGWAGWTTVQRLPEVLNAQQYTDHKNLALVNAGTYNAASNAFYTSLNTDGSPIDTRWYDYVYRTGFSHSNNVSVAGATDATNYYFSMGYTSQQGIIKRNDFRRINVLGNVDQKINKYLSFGGKISFSNELNLAAASSGSLNGEAFNTAGLGRLAFLNSPNVSPYLPNGAYNINSSGLLGIGANKQGQVGLYNPAASLDLNRSNSENNHLQGNVYIQLKPTNWMTLRTVYGIDYLLTDNEIWSDGRTGEGFIANTFGGSAASSYSKNKRFVWTNTLTLDKSWGKHTVSVLVGNEQQRSDNVGFGLSRTQVSDPFYTNLQGGFVQAPLAAGLGIGENYLLSGFASMKYNYKNKYFLSGNYRRDGASQLGANNKYGNFYGASLGWELTREGFWEKWKLDKAFSSFKLRASYGKVGNISGLGNYGTLSTYSAGLYGGFATLAFTNAGNPSLTWETSKKTDIGLNIGVLKDRFTVEFTWYKNNIDGLIIAVPQPPSAGLPNSINTNVGSMYNQGYELTLNANVVQGKNFTWTSSFNVSHNENRVTSLAPGVTRIIASTSGLESPSITLPGYALGMLFVTRTAGVDPATGRRIFINAAGRQVFFDLSAPTAAQRYKYADGSIAPSVGSQDAVIYKNTDPHIYGGFDNTFRYKGFELNALITFQADFWVYYGSYAGLRDQRYWNNSTDVLRRWTKPGDVTDMPRPVFGDNISNGSSFPLDVNVFKGDFVKLRTVTLAYNVPKALVDKARFNSIRFYISGNNLAIKTKYPGPDPEVSSNGNGAINQGVDRNTVANGRQITVGLNIGF
ncbi:MAG: SusC/RagA family TonB-linked outer membrane protein [Chitinophagaceae bacterium]|nr:SusC/RagA family TonB-linked outer membrane protein [Chitinophagaceae bacterium]